MADLRDLYQPLREEMTRLVAQIDDLARLGKNRTAAYYYASGKLAGLRYADDGAMNLRAGRAFDEAEEEA